VIGIEQETGETWSMKLAFIWCRLAKASCPLFQGLTGWLGERSRQLHGINW